MKRCISIVMALAFLMSLVPVNAVVPASPESLVDLVQDFNQENKISAPETVEKIPTEEAVEKQEVSYQTVETSEMTPISVYSGDVQEIHNEETEVLNTIPVSNETEEASKTESKDSKEEAEYYGFLMRENAKARKALDKLKSLPSGFDWHIEKVSDDKIEEPVKEISEEVAEEATEEDDEEIGETFETQLKEDNEGVEISAEEIIEIETEENYVSNSVLSLSSEDNVASGGSNAGSSSSGGGGASTGTTTPSTGTGTPKTISGTVTFPASAYIEENSRMSVSIYKAPVIENGKVVKEKEAYMDAYKTLAAGQTYVDFSFEVYDGEYIVSTYFISDNRAIVNNDYYYTANGLVTNEFAAEVINVTGNMNSINMSIPQAPNYISGRLDFSNCIPQYDAWMHIGLNPENYNYAMYSGASFEIPAGATYYDYEIGVISGAYQINFSGDFFGYGTYASGTISNNYKNRTVLNIENSIENFDVIVPSANQGETDEGETDGFYESYNITINFANEYSEEKEFLFALIADYGDYLSMEDAYSIYLDAGETSSTAEFYIYTEEDVKYYLGYIDITGNDNWGWNEDYPFQYYSENDGTVSSIYDATSINGKYNIVINEPETVEISGSLIIQEDITLSGYGYVGARFNDDSTFITSVNLQNEEYHLYVPQKYVGEEFEMFFAAALVSYIDGTLVYSDEIYVLQNSQSIDVDTGKYRNISGAIKLPMPAPESGAVARLNTDTAVENFVFNSGDESIEYNFAIPNNSVTQSSWVNAKLEIFEPFDVITFNYDSNIGESIYFDESVNISGTITLPDDVVYDKDVSVEIGLIGKSRSYYSTWTILKGQQQVNYSMKFPKYETILEIEAYFLDSEIPLADYWLEYGSSVVEDTIFDINLERAKTIEGTVSLPQGITFDGDVVEYYVFAKSSDGMRYDTDYFEVSSPEKETPFSIKVSSDENVTYNLGIYVEYSGDSEFSTIAANYNAYYVSDYVMAYDWSEAVEVPADSVCHLNFPLNRHISGTITFPENAFAQGELEANVNVTTTYGSNSYKVIPITRVDEPVNYDIWLPRHMDDVNFSIGIYSADRNGTAAGSADDYQPVKTNISTGTYFYSEEQGFVSEYQQQTMLTLEEDDVVLPQLDILEAIKATGRVIFPEDFVSVGALEYIDLSTRNINNEYGSGATAFLDENNNFEAYFPGYMTGDYYVYAYRPWNTSTNILQGEYYHTNDSGEQVLSTFAQGVTTEGIEIEFETGYALSGTITLPADAYIGVETSIDVNINYGDANDNIRFTNGVTTASYILPVSKDVVTEQPININVYAYSKNNGSLQHNISTGQYFYGLDGTLVTDTADAEVVTVSANTQKDFELITGIPVSFEIARPKGSYQFINGDVFLTYEAPADEDEEGETATEWFEVYGYFTMQEDVDSAVTTVVVPKEYANKAVKASYSLYQGDVYTSGRVWVNPDGSLTKIPAEAQTYTVSEDTVVDFTLGTTKELAKTISGTITFEDGCKLSENESFYVYVYAETSTGAEMGYTAIRVDSTTKSYNYKITLSEGYSGDYRIRVYSNPYYGTNICDGNIYYTSGGVTTGSSSATYVVGDSTNINIEIPKLTEVTGKIIVDENYEYLTPMDRLSIIYQTSSTGHYCGASIDENMNFTAYVPYRIQGTCQIGIQIPYAASNNLIKDEYWAAGSYTVNAGADIENVNIAVETGYTVRGKVKLPENIQIPEGNSISYTLCLGSGYDRDNEHLSFDAENTEAEFMFAAPKTVGNQYYIKAYGGCSGQTPVNVYVGEIWYSNDGTKYYDDNYNTFAIEGDIADIELEIPTGVLVNLAITNPSNQYLYGYFEIEELEGQYSREVHYSCNSRGSYNAWTVLPETTIGDAVTIGYKNNSSVNGYYIPWYVYMNRDGKFYSEMDKGSLYILAEENNFDITVPLSTDVVYPAAVLQSDHPYSSNEDKTYTYTYDGDADSLMVTFSQNTQTESCDYIYVYDANGNLVGNYSGYDLQSETIVVPGNSFSIRLTSDGSVEYFGFAITEVRPVVTHTVTFKNWDGTVLDTVTVLDGEGATYTGLTPERAEDGDGITKYRFIGWDKEFDCITEDTEVIALFEEIIIYLESEHPYANNSNIAFNYTYEGEADALRITFSSSTETESGYDYISIYNEDGSLQGKYSGTQLQGLSVTVQGKSFKIVLTSDGSITRYGFEVVGITPVKEYYTVTFKNWDGTVLDTVTVPAGGTAYYDGETPTRTEADVEYEFVGWSKALTEINEDLEVTAVFNKVEYVTVNYYNYDNTLLYSETLRKGESSTYPNPVPYRPADEDGIGYVFSGWDKVLTSIYYDTNLYAQYIRRVVTTISTEEELRAINNNLGGVYALANDIELTYEWTPIGDPINTFTGVLDGNGYSIKNVTFDLSSNEAAFFNTIDNAVVRNLNLEIAFNAEGYTNDVYVAPFVITAFNSDLRNVHVKGNITLNTDKDKDNTVSGFADEITNCYVDGASSNVDIVSGGYIAGFAQVLNRTNIQNSYYNGSVTSGDYISSVAGFVEEVNSSDDTSIDTSYSNMTLDLPQDIVVINAAPFVNVKAGSEDTVSIKNSYYNNDAFNLEPRVDYGEVTALGTGLTEEEMKNQNSFVGFDFGTVWEMGEEGYPVLSAEGGKICSEHNFTEWEMISEVSCTQDGLYTRKCTKCGRIEKNVIDAYGHTFGEWTLLKEASVLAEGAKTRECSVCHTVETEVIEKIAIDLDNPDYGLVHFNVVDAVTLKPINNAQIFISTDNDGENTFYTDAEGKLSQVLPIGIVNASVYASGYLTRGVKLNVISGEQTAPTIGISNKPLVEAKLSSKVMTYDEIIDAGIDPDAPGNNHIVKYSVALTFGTEKADVVTYFNGNHTCVGNTRIPVRLSTGTVYVYPVSENFYLMVYGEVQWLKEMFDVEMLIMNNSNVEGDVVKECTAELTLPDGLSLAIMKDEQQTLKQNVADIAPGGSSSVHWYVKGDVAGEYNISASLKAILGELETVIDQNYTLEEPIKVYAGNAMHMDIYVPDMTFYGDSYPIKIELTNVSDRTLYNVSNTIKYFKEGKVTHYSNGAFVSETYFTEDSIASIGSSEFKPGDKISIEVQADIEFRSTLLRAGLDEIKKYVGNIDALLSAYEAYIMGAKTINESYVLLNDMKLKIAEIITTKDYKDSNLEAAENLLTALTDFVEVVKVSESQKSVDLLNKLKTTGVYKLLTDICENGDVFATYRANRIGKFVNTITAIVKSENISSTNAVNEEMLFELLRRAIESIPIKYYLEDVLVSTLEGSTTSIPYTIHRVTPEERFSSIERLDSYLNSVIETALGHIDSPWIMGVLSGSNTTYEDSEDVIFTNGMVNQFAASDNFGDVEFKVWTADGSSNLEITCTNETAVMNDGVLTFTGPGYISVKALETGSGTLYIEKAGVVKEYNYMVVEAHTCEALEPITLISPDASTEGYMLCLCSICKSIISIDKHKTACEEHIYGEFVTDMDSNGEELGIKHRVCKECGHMQYLVIDESIDYMDFILTPESKLNIVGKTDEEGNYLKQVLAGITVEQIVSNFENEGIEVISHNGNTITGNAMVGTGSKLVITSEDGKQRAELVVVVKGDTNGTGDVTVSDLIKVFNHVWDEETQALTGHFLEAAYINDDSVVGLSDLIRLFNAIFNDEVLR